MIGLLRELREKLEMSVTISLRAKRLREQKTTKGVKSMIRKKSIQQIAFAGCSIALVSGLAFLSDSTSNLKSVFADTHTGSGGTLIVGMSARNVPIPETPPNEGSEGYRFVGNSIYDALTHFDLSSPDELPTIIGGLAESWEVAEDKITWTFNLREGVEFHDGTPFNSEAVVFAFDRILDREFEFFEQRLSGIISAQTQEIESYQAVDEYTFEITTKTPYSFLPSDLPQIYIPSPTAVETYGNEEYRNHASGTGPFRMVEYVDGGFMELEANEDYWGGRPKLDRLILRPFGDPSTRLSALLSGDINWAEVPAPDSLDLLDSQGFNISMRSYPHTIVIPLNTTRAPFDDVRVRQALQFAIDRVSMCEALLNNVCDPASQFLFEGHFWHNPDVENKYELNLDKARELLAEAGYADGLDIRIAFPTGGSGNMYPGPMMELMQSNFADIGVNMEIVPMEWNNITALNRASLVAPEGENLDGFYISWGMDLPSRLSRFNTDRIPPEGCCNPMHYSNPDVDALYQKAMESFDIDTRDQYLREAMGIMSDESPLLFVVHDRNLRVLADNVKGFVHPSHWWADLTSIWVEE